MLLHPVIGHAEIDGVTLEQLAEKSRIVWVTIGQLGNFSLDSQLHIPFGVGKGTEF